MKPRTRWLNAYIAAVHKTADAIEVSVWEKGNTSDRPNASILLDHKTARKLGKELKS